MLFPIFHLYGKKNLSRQNEQQKSARSFKYRSWTHENVQTESTVEYDSDPDTRIY